jgi:hypothetical protein
VESRPYCLTRRRLFRWLAGSRKRGLLTDIDKSQEGPMQITSVRYRELVSSRGCEHKALKATVGLGEPLPSEGKGHTFESCRVRQLFFVLQRDMQTQPETSVLIHSRE